MKRGNMLNAEISTVIAHMGHTDGLTIGDAGLPIPAGPARIDLALRPGVPRFSQVLSTVLEELCVERIIMAEEIRDANPEGLEEILEIIALYEQKTGYKPAIIFISHDEFKKKTAQTKAIIRSGEMMPYANIILYSGVTF
jgi:D-ribose pyranase